MDNSTPDVIKDAAADPQRRRTPMRRVAVASGIGTTIEYYDFFIYGTAAALVFPTVFFPALGTLAGTVASFGTFAVAFIARPLGAILFGHYGDRLGRKNTLIATLLLMGASTFLIGLLPGASTLGVAAPLILVLLRFGQGFAVGGEWAGATLLTAEYAPRQKRGFYAMFPQLGPSAAFVLSSGTFLITGAVLGDTNDVFLDYGWRVPFLLSGFLVIFGLYVRLAIDETPVYRAAQQDAGQKPTRRTSLPLTEAWRAQKREMLLAAGALASLFAFFYIGTAYLTSYGTQVLGFSRPFILWTGLGAGTLFGIAIGLSASLSDRVGRRKVIMAACAVAVPWSIALFPLLDTGSPLAFFVGTAVTLALFGVGFGPTGALLPELFDTRYRYTGAGVGYNLAGVLGGAIPPLLAAPLAEQFGSISIGVMMAVISLISFICTRSLVERTSTSML